MPKEKIMNNNTLKVEQLAQEIGSLDEVKRLIRNTQSIKNTIKKQKHKLTYSIDLAAILDQEELLKQVRQLLDPKDKPVTIYTEADIKVLDYNQTVKAIKSIQCKKHHTRYSTENPETNSEFLRACSIEEQLLAHKLTVKPLPEEQIYKSDLIKIIDTIEESGILSQEKIIELLRELI